MMSIELIDYSSDFAHLRDESYWRSQQVVGIITKTKREPIFPNDYYVYTHFMVIPFHKSITFDFLSKKDKKSPEILERVAVKYFCGNECVSERIKKIEWMKGFEFNVKYEIEEILYRDLKLKV